MIPDTRPEEVQRPQEQPSAADVPSTLDSRANRAGDEVRTVPPLALPGYEVLSELGRGGMGVVYQARMIKDHRLVAIKMLRDGVLADAKHLTRFHSEARTLSSLEHPNFLKIYEIGDYQGRPFLALQFAEGGNLADRIGKALPAPADSARLIETLAGAMQYAHDRGIVHRDLKPANILLVSGGCEPPGPTLPGAAAERHPPPLAGARPMIADFGLAKHLDFQGMTHTGDLLGTPNYMAPEQAEARHDDVGPATDIYALGAILYELLTGQPPFKGPTLFATLEQVRSQQPVPPSRLKPGVPPDLEAICLKCLRKDPRKRYDSMARLASELRHFLTGQPLEHTESLGHVDRQARRLVQRALGRGRRALDRGDLLASLPWFVRALHLDQGNRRQELIHRIRLSSVLRHGPRLLRLWFLPSPIVRGVCAPTGQFAAVLGEDNGVRVLDLSGSGNPRVLRHTGGVQCLAFRRDGQRLVTGSDDGTARLWDVATGELTLPLLVHGQWITHASFSNDGRLLVTGGMDGSARVWEVATGLPVCRLAERTALVWSAAFSEDGTRVVTAGLDGVTRAWNVATGQPVGPPLKHGAPVRHASFSPGGSRLATAGDDRTARVWQVASGIPVVALLHEKPVRHAWFSRDGGRLLTADEDGMTYIWDAVTGNPVAARVPAGVLGEHPLRTPDGRRELRFDERGVVWLWDWAPCPPALPRGREEGGPPSTLTPGPCPLTPPYSGIEGERVAVSGDGFLAVTLTPGGELCVWDAASREPVTLPWQAPAPLRELRFSADGTQVRAIAEDGARSSWPLAPEARPVEDLFLLAQLLAGHRPQGSGRLQPLEPGTLSDTLKAMRDRYPDDFRVGAADVWRWHESALEICTGLELWQESLRHLTALIEVEPGRARHWERRGRTYARLRQWEQAAADFTEALNRREDGRLWYRLGLTRACMGQWQRAVEDLTRAARLRGDDGDVWFRLGSVRTHARQFAEALEDFSRAVRLKPNARECWAERARVQALLGHWSDADADFARAAALGDDRPWVGYQHALVKLKRGNPEGYNALCRSLISQAARERDPAVGAWAAWACVLGGATAVNPKEVVYWAWQAGQEFGTAGADLQSFCATLLGAALFRAGQFGAALKQLNVSAQSPGTPWDWFFLAMATRGTHDGPAAAQWLERGLRWLSDSAPTAGLPWHQRLELELLAEQARLVRTKEEPV